MCRVVGGVYWIVTPLKTPIPLETPFEPQEKSNTIVTEILPTRIVQPWKGLIDIVWILICPAFFKR